MHIVEVTNEATARDFLNVQPLMHRGNPNYIRPLDKDIRDVFDPKKNKAFRFGEAVRWILKNDQGELLGRIAAFTNKKYRNKGDELPVGGIGFFDCTFNQEAANLLFDTARTWLAAKGMEAMDGPINFGERDRWWGLVVEGFQEPLYGMNYNLPYYQELFEHYGFRPFFHQVCFGRNPKAELTPKIAERHEQIARNKDFSVRCIDKRHLEKYAGDFATVYNAAWAGHGGLKEMRKEQAVQLFKKMKPVMDEKIIWFTYCKEEPIALFVNLPDLNQWFKYLNGKFDLWHKLKFLWVKKTKPCRKFTGIVFGIVPKYQGKGLDSFMVGEAYKIIKTPQVPYTEYEMQWIGDFNPKMLNVAENLGDVYRSRLLTTYRFLFDREREFRRHPVL
ncbi:MAG TPA: hypothetical protein VHK69_13510 [Chitinophagaceae bacterium]|jgi:hypothetical protein|nr:hypothetical protein [Chitinophagaceae bacterium]